MDGKLKYSNFHITVNSNRDTMENVAEMRAAVEEMVSRKDLWGWLKQYDGTEQINFKRGTKGLVERVRVRAAFEHEGKHNKGLHVHILVEVAHRTMVQVSKQGIVDLFSQFIPHPNVHCRFVRGEGEDKEFILQYITKEVPSRRRFANPGNSQLASVFGDRSSAQVVSASTRLD